MNDFEKTLNELEGCLIHSEDLDQREEVLDFLRGLIKLKNTFSIDDEDRAHNLRNAFIKIEPTISEDGVSMFGQYNDAYKLNRVSIFLADIDKSKDQATLGHPVISFLITDRNLMQGIFYSNYSEGVPAVLASLEKQNIGGYKSNLQLKERIGRNIGALKTEVLERVGDFEGLDEKLMKPGKLTKATKTRIWGFVRYFSETMPSNAKFWMDRTDSHIDKATSNLKSDIGSFLAAKRSGAQPLMLEGRAKKSVLEQYIDDDFMEKVSSFLEKYGVDNSQFKIRERSVRDKRELIVNFAKTNGHISIYGNVEKGSQFVSLDVSRGYFLPRDEKFGSDYDDQLWSGQQIMRLEISQDRILELLRNDGMSEATPCSITRFPAVGEVLKNDVYVHNKHKIADNSFDEVAEIFSPIKELSSEIRNILSQDVSKVQDKKDLVIALNSLREVALDIAQSFDGVYREHTHNVLANAEKQTNDYISNAEKEYGHTLPSSINSKRLTKF